MVEAGLDKKIIFYIKKPFDHSSLRSKYGRSRTVSGLLRINFKIPHSMPVASSANQIAPGSPRPAPGQG